MLSLFVVLAFAVGMGAIIRKVRRDQQAEASSPYGDGHPHREMRAKRRYL